MNIDYIIKIGGSLFSDAKKLQLLLIKLEKSRLNAAYTVGSGYLGDVFKKYLVSNKITQKISSSIKCWSNIQSINARTICDINLSFVTCVNFEEVIDSLLSKTCPIIDNNGFYECFKDSYYQATDVKSAIICKHLKCRKLLILTDVNGIYTEDPKKSYTASKLQKINAKNLISMGRTSVDLGLAEKVIEFGIMVFVLGIDSILNSTVTMEELIFSEITMIIL